jgi:hypothetical protein
MVEFTPREWNLRRSIYFWDSDPIFITQFQVLSRVVAIMDEIAPYQMSYIIQGLKMCKSEDLIIKYCFVIVIP